MLEQLFPEGVVAVEARPEMWTAPLHPQERACLGRAVPRRRREFAAGRACAREALARLGIVGFPLLPEPDRVPRWPAGVVGSISHCDGYCAAVVARSERFGGLGLDVELASPLEPELVAQVCRPRELARLASRPAPPGADWAKLLFSAKESTYKCYYPLGRTILEFHDVEVVIEPEARRFRATLVNDSVPGSPRRFEGRFACDGARVYTGVAIAAEGTAAQAPEPAP